MNGSCSAIWAILDELLDTWRLVRGAGRGQHCRTVVMPPTRALERAKPVLQFGHGGTCSSDRRFHFHHV